MEDGSAKETDQVMQKKLEASGFIPGWFTRLRDTSRDGIRNDREVNTGGLFLFFVFFSSILAEPSCANNGCRAFCWTCFTFTESFRADYVTSGGHVSPLKDILLFAKRHFETRQKAD